MKPRKPWQPHVSNDTLLNPFAPTTEAAQPIQRIEIEAEEEGEEGEEETGKTESQAQPPTDDESAGG